MVRDSRGKGGGLSFDVERNGMKIREKSKEQLDLIANVAVAVTVPVTVPAMLR